MLLEAVGLSKCFLLTAVLGFSVFCSFCLLLNGMYVGLDLLVSLFLVIIRVRTHLVC